MKKILSVLVLIFLSFNCFGNDESSTDEDSFLFEGYFTTQIKLPDGVLYHEYNVDFTHYGFWFGYERLDYYKIVEKKPKLFDIYYYKKNLYIPKDNKCEDLEVIVDNYCLKKIELDAKNPENFILRTLDNKIFFLERSHRFDK